VFLHALAVYVTQLLLIWITPQVVLGDAAFDYIFVTLLSVNYIGFSFLLAASVPEIEAS